MALTKKFFINYLYCGVYKYCQAHSPQALPLIAMRIQSIAAADDQGYDTKYL